MDPIIRQVAEVEILTGKMHTELELSSIASQKEKPRLNRFFVNVYKKLLNRDDYVDLVKRRGCGNLSERKEHVRKRISILEDIYREELRAMFDM